MPRIQLYTLLMLLFLSGCLKTNEDLSQKLPKIKIETPTQVIESFVAELTSLSSQFPELAGFMNQSPDSLNSMEVRFSKGVATIYEMRSVRSYDIEPNGIYLCFLIKPGNNPGWSNRNDRILLNNLGKILSSYFVLPRDATPGLEVKLLAIFTKHRQFLKDMNEKAGIK